MTCKKFFLNEDNGYKSDSTVTIVQHTYLLWDIYANKVMFWEETNTFLN